MIYRVKAIEHYVLYNGLFILIHMYGKNEDI